MVRFQCDGCGVLKDDDAVWILGLAAENIGIASARREISIATSWDRATAVNPLAVHFCSDECRNQYMNRLFGESPETLHGEATVTRRRVRRVVPGAVVDTVVAEAATPVVPRRGRKSRKSA